MGAPRNPRSWSAARLKNETAKVLQRCIVYEAKEADGLVTCVTCGTRKPPGNMQGGHFLGRRNSILFDERNIHPQCVRCNMHEHGKQEEYAIWMLETYGQDVVTDLHRRKHNVSVQYGEAQRPILEAMRCEYLDRLKRAKG